MPSTERTSVLQMQVSYPDEAHTTIVAAVRWLDRWALQAFNPVHELNRR